MKNWTLYKIRRQYKFSILVINYEFNLKKYRLLEDKMFELLWYYSVSYRKVCACCKVQK